MIKVASDADRVAVAKLQEDGQGQIFRFWEELSPADQKELLAEIRELDLPKLKDLVQHYRESDSEAVTGQVYEPSHFAELPSSEESRSRWLAAREAGEDALRNGKVAVVLSAGDPGENAGFTAPKGTYPVGPVSGKCLYRLHAEKLLALGKKYRATPPLFVVSSSETHDATVGHFQDHDNFKLNRQDVKHVVQESLPVINKRGQLILRSRCGLALKPTGHGGVMARVLEEDIFKKLEIQGIEYLFFFQVGNPLVQIADPSLIGHHVVGQYDVSSKTVRKSEPDESIGVFCRHNGALTIVRPDQLAEDELHRRLDDGRLVHCAGDLANHVFSMDFLQRFRESSTPIPYHCVEQRTPCVDRRGRLVNPRKPNSIVFERSIADFLSQAEKTLVVEACREEEFLPISNSEGDDSPESARRALARVFRSWLENAGVAPTSSNGAGSSDPDNDCLVEISPLYAMTPDDLRDRLRKEHDDEPLKLETGLYLE